MHESSQGYQTVCVMMSLQLAIGQHWPSGDFEAFIHNFLALIIDDV